MKSRTLLFNKLRNETAAQYTNAQWPAAKRWLARVGHPRLTAENAAAEAAGLLYSIHRGIHRNEPELENLLYDARKAAREYNVALMRDNWRRFEGRPRP